MTAEEAKIHTKEAKAQKLRQSMDGIYNCINTSALYGEYHCWWHEKPSKEVIEKLKEDKFKIEESYGEEGYRLRISWE